MFQGLRQCPRYILAWPLCNPHPPRDWTLNPIPSLRFGTTFSGRHWQGSSGTVRSIPLALGLCWPQNIYLNLTPALVCSFSWISGCHHLVFLILAFRSFLYLVACDLPVLSLSIDSMSVDCLWQRHTSFLNLDVPCEPGLQYPSRARVRDSLPSSD